MNEGDAEKLGKLLADNLVVEYPGQPKMNKDQWIEFTKNFKALNHELFLAPVLTVPDKETRGGVAPYATPQLVKEIADSWH